jgi:uncharacterized protein involved in outer membrane biogenesis
VSGRRRRLVLVVGGLVLAAAVCAGGLAFLVSRRADHLLVAAGKRLGRPLHAERVGAWVGTTVGVRLTDARVDDDPAFASEGPFITARSLAMGVRLWPLVRDRRVVVDRVLADGPDVRIVHTADGRLNVDSLREHARRRKKAQTEPDDGGDGHGSAFQVARLEVRRGTVRFEDQATWRTVFLTDLDVTASQPEVAAAMPVTLGARVDAGPVQVERLTSEGRLDLVGAGALYYGSLRADAARLGPLAVGATEAQVQVAPPMVLLQRIRASVLGGMVSGWARASSGGESEGFKAEIDGRDLWLEQLPLAPDRPHPAGKLALHATIGGALPGAERFRKSLAASGRFEIAQGRITNLRLGGAIEDLLGPAIGPGVGDHLRARYGDLFGDDLQFNVLAGSGELRDGRIRTEDLRLAGPSFQARGAGSLGLGGNLDLQLELSASAALTQDLLGTLPTRAALVDERGVLTIPLHVGGNLSRPRVKPDPEFVARAAQALLKGAGLEDIAGGVMREILKGGKRPEMDAPR